MKITWEDRKNRGSIDGVSITTKPNFSFNYAWFQVTDTDAQYVGSHDEGIYNKDMSEAQKDEVMSFYSSYVFTGEVPSFDETTHKAVESTVTEVIDGKTYSTYDIVELTTEELEAIAKARVPSVITIRQAKLALLDQGLLATVDNAVANSTDEEMKIEWAYTTEVRRDWQSLITMATGLGMTGTDLDNLFILAETF